MNASASLPLARFPNSVARTLMAALMVATFVIGGTGGYLVRGLNLSWPPGAAGTPTVRDATERPFVTEQAPAYASPAPPESRRVGD